METCQRCGAEFTINPSQPGLKRIYCSQFCCKKANQAKRRKRNQENPLRFFVYLLMTKDGKPYYVGKGSCERINLSKRRHRLPDGDKPEAIKLKQNLTETDALRYERYFIEVFGRKEDGGLLINEMTEDKRTPRT